MKKIFNSRTIIACILLILASSKVNAQKNYASIETGYFFGGPSKQIANEFKKNGFGDLSIFNLEFYGIVIDSKTYYPMISSGSNIKGRIRYGRELTKNTTLEINVSLLHKGEVKGYDNANIEEDHYINFSSRVTALSATYILNNTKKNSGIGIGPVMALYKLDITQRSSSNDIYNYTSNTSSISHTHIQPGLTVTGLWRFVNKPVYFMDLRSDFIMFSPVKASAVSGKETNFDFPSVKINNFYSSITVSAGIKF
ncbi:hypothetical protein FRZ67_20265 [Panacibacter ginsenosidivorans]|uniref:Outer membrane beta-barrel protein n=1 Tax=Panacibacter ginsenosidivorans TaxID=1813871 RepID=A0A5B8VDX3_9BACT|nr:hypothetical protein [Panacibacter ginsenosidivorans]QEC69522.1 hypothetical protein FRZ67_20265 [Panacibacter ginsenosidivorans]